MLVRNIGPVALLALMMVSLPYVLGYFLGFRYSGEPFFELETAVGSWRGILATTLEVFLTTCLHTVLVVGVYETLQGRRPAARALVQSGLVRFPAVIAVVVVVCLPGPLILGSLEVLLVETLSFPVGLLLIVTWSFLILAWSILFCVAIPAAVVEGLGVKRSIARSVKLVRSGVFRVIGLFLVAFVMVFVAPSLVLEWAGIDLAAGSYRVLVWPDLLLAAFEDALFAVMGTVAYHDLRVSREGSELMPVAALERPAR